jgi:hypothetical protein
MSNGHRMIRRVIAKYTVATIFLALSATASAAGLVGSADEGSMPDSGAHPALRPHYGPGPVYPAGPVQSDTFGIAFDVPDGWLAERSSDTRFYWLRRASGESPLDLSIETHPFWFKEPLASSSDTLRSFLEQNLGMFCNASGLDHDQFADSLLTVRRFRTTLGHEAVEFLVRVHEETPDGATSHSAGPFYIVDMNRADSSRWIQVSPGCWGDVEDSVIEAALLIVHSLRRL